MGSDSPWPSTDRRTFLATSGLLGAGVLVGLDGARADASETVQLDEAWPQFQRDAAHTGHAPGATGPTDEWPGVAWQAGTNSDSNPILTEDRIYVLNYSAGNALRAIDRSDGSVLWDAQTHFAHRWKNVTPYALTTPALGDGRVYTATVSGVAATDAESGETVWWAGVNTWTTPVYGDGVLYVVGHGDETVEEEYEQERSLYAFEGATGERLWKEKLEEERGDWDGAPAFVDGVVYVPLGDGIYAFEGATGERLWSAGPDLAGSGTATVADGTVYVPRGDENSYGVYAYDATTGESEWESELGGGFGGGFRTDRHSVAIADGSVVALAQNESEDRLELAALDADTGDERWRFEGLEWPEEATVRTSPVVADGHVYAAGQDREQDNDYLFVLDAETGESVTYARWEGETGAFPNAPPSVDDGVAYVSTIGEGDYSGSLSAVAAGEGVRDEPAGDGPEEVRFWVEPEEPSDCQEAILYADLQDPEEDEYRFHWDVGNDGEIDATTLGHEYSQDEGSDGYAPVGDPVYRSTFGRQFEAGDHEVRVVVEDPYDRTAEETLSFAVVECPAPPTAEIEVLTEDPEVDEPIEFRGHGDGDGVEDDDFRWYVGSSAAGDPDGTSREFVETFHRSEVTVTLAVEDDWGQVTEDSVTVEIDC